MNVPFEKWHGLGNDFVLVRRGDLPEDPDVSVFSDWCDRHRGIGADGVLILWDESEVGFSMRVVNADGAVPEICGNGIRCAVRSWSLRYDAGEGTVRVITDAGEKPCALSADGNVTVEMGPAVLVDGSLPRPEVPGRPATVSYRLGERDERGFAVSIGNPHLVFLLENETKVSAQEARRFENLPEFPQRTNVELVRQVGPNRLSVVVWERGVGFTQACGSGACASAAVAMLEGWLSADETNHIELDGGTLQVSVSSDLSRILMTGPAELVFSGVKSIE